MRNQRSEKFYEVVDDFKITRSYAETARNVGLTRQRVAQIIKKSGIGIKPIRSPMQWVGKNCIECGRPLGEDHKGLKCRTCYAIKVYEKKKLKLKGGVKDE